MAHLTEIERLERQVENLLAHPDQHKAFLQRAGITDTLGRFRSQRFNKSSRFNVDWEAAREALAKRQTSL